LLVARQKRESGDSILDQAFNEILSLPPYQLFEKIKDTLEDYGSTEDQLGLAETLHYEGNCREFTGVRFPKKHGSHRPGRNR
jgi:phosphorylase kinase alpha/beta subunit